MNMPTTPDAARAALADLRSKRPALLAIIDGAAERRRGHAVASEFGDADAKAALDEIDAKVARSKSALGNLDVALGEMTTLAQDLEHAADDRRDALHAEQTYAAVAERLELSDEIDATAERLRALLEKSDELNRNPLLAAARRRGRGTMIGERQIGQTLLAYLDKWTQWLPINTPRFDQVERFAELDGRELGRTSNATAERGPRPLTAAERALAKSITDRGMPIAGTNTAGWPDAPRGAA